MSEIRQSIAQWWLKYLPRHHMPFVLAQYQHGQLYHLDS